jgi:hypothetical protein
MQVAVASVGAAVAAAHGLVGSEAGHRTLLRCVPNGMRSWVSLHGRCHRFPPVPAGGECGERGLPAALVTAK